MARTGLTKSQVKITRELLLAEGKHPSVDAVRHALGDTGSKSTIHKYLKELEAEDEGGVRTGTEQRGGINTLIERLTQQLHADVDNRLASIRAEYELTLREKDRVMAQMSATIDAMSARLKELEARVPDLGSPLQADEQSPSAAQANRGGFGLFESMHTSSRSGANVHSAFGAMLNTARSIVINRDELQPGLMKSLFNN